MKFEAQTLDFGVVGIEIGVRNSRNLVSMVQSPGSEGDNTFEWESR